MFMREEGIVAAIAGLKLFGRPIQRYIVNLARLPQYILYVVRCFRLFQDPWVVLRGYLTGRRPADVGRVRLRSGLTIYLSSDPLDIVTVFLIFVREDYGRILAGSVVIDAGANIGIFSLFAAVKGARIIHAFEPNIASFQCLVRNIDANGLGHIVSAHRVALTGHEGQVRFPVSPSVYNAIIPDGREAVEFDLVEATTLARVLEEMDYVDFFKLDCEGAEYDILLSSGAAELSKCGVICTEYHGGPKEALVNHLQQNGFEATEITDPAGGVGYLRFIRQP